MQTNKISITRNYLLYVLLAVALFFSYRTIFRYGCSNLSNTFICQLTLFFSILVYITIRPSKQFLVSYIPITLLYLLIPVWDFYGTDIYQRDGMDVPLEETIVLTINAIDGSMNDRELGY